MSWDVFAMRVPPGVALSDLPHDHVAAVIGTREAVRDAVLQAAPDADVRDLAWLVVDGPALVVEVGVGDSPEVDSLVFHVRGGEQAVPFVLDVCARLDITPLDTTTGETLRRESGRASQEQWQAYRDRVVGDPPAQ